MNPMFDPREPFLTEFAYWQDAVESGDWSDWINREFDIAHMHDNSDTLLIDLF